MTVNLYLRQLEAVVAATEFHPASTFSWFGKRARPLPAGRRRALTPELRRAHLCGALQDHLYKNFYCKGFARPLKWDRPHPRSPFDTMPFVEALSRANVGTGCWEPGWEVRAIEAGSLLVHQGGLLLRVGRQECRVAPPAAIEVGTRLSVRLPKEMLDVSPGFYTATGNRPLTPDDWQHVVRFYWNLSPAGAIGFMHDATRKLNRADVPFRLKVANDLANAARCDAVVLYVRQCDCDRVRKILTRIYGGLFNEMREGVPALTRPVAPGVGVAEEPRPGGSFGLHRCHLLAEGLIRAHERRAATLARRLQLVVDHLAQEGIQLERPYLNPGAPDSYDFELRAPRPGRRSSSPDPAVCAAPRADTLLHTAHEIGRQLSQTAIWHGDRCSWTGGEALDSQDSLYSTLGPELYSGTGGISLFLAELYAATGDRDIARTALGAVQHALSRVETVPPSQRLGLFTGWVGIAFAAARVAIRLQKDALLDRVRELLHHTRRCRPAVTALDLISGHAGAIAALLDLGQTLADPSLLDFAVALGREVLAAAIESDGGYSWQTVNAARNCPLTGFSHGAAGIAYGLLELFQATGDSAYRRAAERAFDYERLWFDARARNWPDLRDEPRRARRARYPLSFSTFWCHGAPGIALSRLRAGQLLQDASLNAEAHIALQTTQAALEQVSRLPGAMNFSLCHGLAGNADILLIGSQFLGSEFSAGAQAALQVAQTGLRLYAARGHAWPGGSGGATSPGLMLGLAGTGYFYLRVYNPLVPSILLVRGLPQPSTMPVEGRAFRPLSRESVIDL